MSSRLRRLVVVGTTTIIGVTGTAGLTAVTAHAAAAQPTVTMSPSWDGGFFFDRDHHDRDRDRDHHDRDRDRHHDRDRDRDHRDRDHHHR
jgi:hypothetical protein